VLNPSDPSSDIANLITCLHALQSWICLNGMLLNPDNSDATLPGTRQRSRTSVSVRSVDVAGCSVLLCDNIKILSVTLDCHLSLDKHISSVCKSAYYHIRSLRHICLAITDMAKSVASSLVCSCLDYANSLLFGTTQKNINCLQRIKNTLARVVASHALPRGTRSFDILQDLHWLPIDQRIDIEFKLATLTYNILNSSQPAYLRSLLNYHTPTHSLHSANTMPICIYDDDKYVNNGESSDNKKTVQLQIKRKNAKSNGCIALHVNPIQSYHHQPPYWIRVSHR